MSRNAITEQYLVEVAARGVGPDELSATALASADLRPTTYQGRCLSRPAFLSDAERARLEHDLAQLRGALAALPRRRFGGDLAAFARALGLVDAQVATVARGGWPELTRLARADIYHDGTDFRLMELNLGSPVGGLDNALLNRAMLHHPMLAEFVAAHKLSYVDGLATVSDTLRSECGLPAGERLFMAAVDKPTSFAKLAPLLRASAAALADYGIDAVACHLGELTVREGRVWYENRPVDVLYRIFLLDDLRDPEIAALLEPLLRAAEQGAVAMFTPIDVDLYTNKATLAMLSDEAHRGQLTPAELASLDRLLPWTRQVRDEEVTVDGDKVRLPEFAIAHRAELVLKPTALYGGEGVVLGWEVDGGQWRRQLAAAMDGPYVLQRRLVGEPELFPGPGGLSRWLLRWGVFTGHQGYAGSLVIGSTDLTGGVLNISGGATGGCCFHESVASMSPAAEF